MWRSVGCLGTGREGVSRWSPPVRRLGLVQPVWTVAQPLLERGVQLVVDGRAHLLELEFVALLQRQQARRATELRIAAPR